MFVVQNGLLLDRVLFTFNKKYGNSVQRNRSRRISREAYRMIKHRLMIGFDFVVLVYPGADNLETRMGQLEGVFSKAGLFTEVK